MALGLGLGLGFRALGVPGSINTDLSPAVRNLILTGNAPTVAVASLPATDIALSAATVAEDADLGTVIGTISASGGVPSYTFTLTDDDDGKFAVDGTDLILTGVLDYETATSHSITIRATNAGGNYDEIFSITVTDVSEAPPTDPPPEGEVEDDGQFVVTPIVTQVDGAVKLSGKKNTGASGKFIYNIGPPIAGAIYTMKYTPDWSLLSNGGVTAFVGFGLRENNDFRMSGIQGDGSTGVKAFEISGTNPNGWNQTTGHSTSDGGAAQHGTQSGPNWVQFQVATDGSTYTMRTSSDGSTWSDEFTNVTPSPFSNVTDSDGFGIAVYLQAADDGPFSVSIDLWTQVEVLIGAIVKNTSDSASLNYNGVVLTFGAENADTHGFHSTVTDTGRLTIPSSMNGRYGVVYAQTSQTGVVSGTKINGVIKMNGNFVYLGAAAVACSNDEYAVAFMNFQTQPILLATSDYFELHLGCDDPTTVLEADNTSFSILIVG